MGRVEIYLGALTHSRGEGKTAYAYRLEYKKRDGQMHIRNGDGVLLQATKNRATVQAAVEALRRITRPIEITIHTDSDYFKRIFPELEKYQEMGWKTKSNKDLKNADLWRLITMKKRIHPIEVKVEQTGMESYLQEVYERK